jgi:hypothetical protein
MITLVGPNDNRAIRNKDNVLAWYDLMINRKKPEEAAAKFVPCQSALEWAPGSASKRLFA